MNGRQFQAGQEPRQVSALHVEDLELARRCADGDETAWQRFMLEYRPVLYRAADAIEPGGGARDLADSLYADLYGLTGGDRQRASLFRYFQGRSSLATWLRAVLAQRYVDRLRAQRRLVPLPDAEQRAQRPSARHHEAVTVASRDPAKDPAPDPAHDPDRPRQLALLRRALGRAVARLGDRDRLRLGCYYVQELTLAQIGRALKEHEATASRQLARTRRAIREDVERQLREEAGLKDAQIAECFESAAEDAGPLDLKQMLGAAAGRKVAVPDRSI
jgi:RNA polymerase sigma factor (sigma-70 family)